MGGTEEANIAFLMFIGIIGMLLLAVAVVIFFLVYQRRMLAQQDHIRTLELEYQRQSLDAIIQAQEAERKRIAQDLHDEVGSKLSATKLFLKRLDQQREAPDFDDLKKETVDILDETILNIRSITRNLLPLSLEKFGLIAATEDLCKRLRELQLFEVDFKYNLDRRFDVQQEFALYRIIQELINNTLKHAKASGISIQFLFEADQIQMTYKDNGKGFDLSLWKDKQQLPAGLGLRSIESRVNWLEAKLDWRSAENEGFLVLISLNIR